MKPEEIPFERTNRILGGVARKNARACGIPQEDLHSILWVRLLSRCPKYDPIKMDWPGFVMLTAITESVDRIRVRKRRRELAGWQHFTDEFPCRSDNLPGPFAVSALWVLTDRESQALVLYLGLDGAAPRSTGAVAFMLGVGRSTVENRIRRSIEKLRKYLSEGEEE